MKKCVIIGSGLGGLSCGCILARNGYEVTVLEQAGQIGGCLQCFHRGDAVFETGMHYIGSAKPGQTLHTLWRYLGVEQQVALSQLDPMGYDVIAFQGQHYAFANNKEQFIDSLAEHFPHSRQELTRYYDLVKLVAASSPMHSLNDDVDFCVYANYMSQPVNEVIDSIITDPLLRQVLVGILPLYAGQKGHTPFSTHALIADFYDQSAFRIVGGSSNLADALRLSITNMGGHVLTRQQAIKIECNHEQATAVVCEQDTFPADLIVSAIHPVSTMQLIDSHLVRPVYRRRIMSLKNTTSVFTVYLKFKKNTVRYMNHNIYYYRSKSTWGCEEYDANSWPKELLYMHFCHEQKPVYAETGQIMAYMNFDEVSQWQHTHIHKRGEDYEAFKRQKAETIIRALEEEVPGISNSIETYYTSTPLTYLDYTGTPQGSMYGVARDVNAVASGNVSSRTSIPNLLLAGQCITSHGMLGVLAGSLLTCAEVITREELFRQLHALN